MTPPKSAAEAEVELLFYRIETSEGFEYFCRPNDVQKMFESFEIKLDEIAEADEPPFSLTITGQGLTERQYQQWLEDVAEGGEL